MSNSGNVPICLEHVVALHQSLAAIVTAKSSLIAKTEAQGVAAYDGDWYVTPVIFLTTSSPPRAASPLLIRDEANGTV